MRAFIFLFSLFFINNLLFAKIPNQGLCKECSTLKVKTHNGWNKKLKNEYTCGDIGWVATRISSYCDGDQKKLITKIEKCITSNGCSDSCAKLRCSGVPDRGLCKENPSISIVTNKNGKNKTYNCGDAGWVANHIEDYCKGDQSFLLKQIEDCFYDSKKNCKNLKCSGADVKTIKNSLNNYEYTLDSGEEIVIDKNEIIDTEQSETVDIRNFEKKSEEKIEKEPSSDSGEEIVIDTEQSEIETVDIRNFEKKSEEKIEKEPSNEHLKNASNSMLICNKNVPGIEYYPYFLDQINNSSEYNLSSQYDKFKKLGITGLNFTNWNVKYWFGVTVFSENRSTGENEISDLATAITILNRADWELGCVPYATVNNQYSHWYEVKKRKISLSDYTKNSSVWNDTTAHASLVYDPIYYATHYQKRHRHLDKLKRNFRLVNCIVDNFEEFKSIGQSSGIGTFMVYPSKVRSKPKDYYNKYPTSKYTHNYATNSFKSFCPKNVAKKGYCGNPMRDSNGVAIATGSFYTANHYNFKKQKSNIKEIQNVYNMLERFYENYCK